MKKVLFSVVAVAIAIVSVAFAKANPNMFEPQCPTGSQLFYFQDDSQIYASGTPLLNALNTTSKWSLTPLTSDEEDVDCGGTVRICAICAPETSPGVPNLSSLQSAFQTYSSNRATGSDDSQPFVLFEKNIDAPAIK